MGKPEEFGSSPYSAKQFLGFQPCYECGRESAQYWGWYVHDAEGNMILSDMSQVQAEYLACLLNRDSGALPKQG